MYNLDIVKFVRRLLPPFLRTVIQRAWIETLLKASGTLIADFQEYRAAKLSELSYSGETIQLERHLNDFFDPLRRRIKIKHFADNVEFDYLLEENGTIEDYDYLKSESIDTGFIFLIGENVNPIDVDFVVLFPADLDKTVAEIRSHVEKYRLAGRRYTIEFI